MIKTGFTAIALALVFPLSATAMEKDPTLQAENSFVIIGDQPYTPEEEKAWKTRLIPWLKKNQRDIGFLFHYGDTKSGGAPCSKEIIKGNLDLIFSLVEQRTVFVPGDNDWTDCDRDIIVDEGKASLAKAKAEFPGRVFFGKNYKGKTSHQVRGYSELQALRDIRSILQQASAPKLAHFRYFNKHKDSYSFLHNDMVFAGIHIVGGNNGWYQVLKDEQKDYVSAALQREQEVIASIKAAFADAKQHKARALVIGIHADMFDIWADRTEMVGPCTKDPKDQCSGFIHIKNALRDELKSFGKPFLLVHGDSSPHCLDRPWKKDLPNFWRLNGPGDGVKGTEANIVEFRPGKKKPFRVVDYQSFEKISKTCEYKEDM